MTQCPISGESCLRFACLEKPICENIANDVKGVTIAAAHAWMNPETTAEQRATILPLLVLSWRKLRESLLTTDHQLSDVHDIIIRGFTDALCEINPDFDGPDFGQLLAIQTDLFQKAGLV